MDLPLPLQFARGQKRKGRGPGPWHIVRRVHTSGKGRRFVTMMCKARTVEPTIGEPDPDRLCESCIEQLVKLQS